MLDGDFSMVEPSKKKFDTLTTKQMKAAQRILDGMAPEDE